MPRHSYPTVSTVLSIARSYGVAAENFDRMAQTHLAASQTHPKGSWRIAADLRIAEKCRAQAEQCRADIALRGDRKRRATNVTEED